DQEASEAVYASVAALINAKPGEIALMGSHTLAWQSLFQGLRFEEGDRILTARSEYAANYVAMLQMQKRTGCVIDVIPCRNDGATDPVALDKMIDDRVKLIAINWIPTNGGLMNPAADIGRVARAHGIPYLLDACQAVGQMPVDVEELGCDYLSATGRKWLRGPKGTGFLYVREEKLSEPGCEPGIIDDIGAPWTRLDGYDLLDTARRFETHENAPALRLGLGAAVEYARALGLETIRGRVKHLADGLRSELAGLPGIAVQDLGTEHAGLVTFAHDTVAAADITAALLNEKITVKTIPLAGAYLDTLARNIPELVRVSAHYYNSEDELETLLKALRAAIGAG
ncbi:MAG: aminotransferase class V-fold PLP-dependent enzyme, partial [Alphaproteobacteria bacterium]